MNNIIIKQMPGFKRIYKKLHINQKTAVDEAIHLIIANSDLGEEKKGDLKGVFVYKFLMQHQEMLLAYEWDPVQRVLLAMGVHENFYRDLKRE